MTLCSGNSPGMPGSGDQAYVVLETKSWSVPHEPSAFTTVLSLSETRLIFLVCSLFFTVQFSLKKLRIKMMTACQIGSWKAP